MMLLRFGCLGFICGRVVWEFLSFCSFLCLVGIMVGWGVSHVVAFSFFWVSSGSGLLLPLWYGVIGNYTCGILKGSLYVGRMSICSILT